MKTGASPLLDSARRIVVKFGSSLLIDPAADAVRQSWLAGVADDLAGLRGQGRQLVVVSSGSVALGRERLGFRRANRLDHKQAAAAMGQPRLMRAWAEAMARHDIATAQLLLTIDDSEQRKRWLNARATIERLLELGALPVINENDTVATEELRYGDNDRLSARAAQMIRADLLILLSDVDGLYDADPARDGEARHISLVDELDAVEAFASGPSAEGVGSGGMKTKLAAARIARSSGCATIIASGREDHPIARLRAGARATVVPAEGSPASAYKQWIASALAPGGDVTIDDGAVRALGDGKSLLPVGVTGVSGRFDRGACLRVLDPGGSEVARGIAGYDSSEVQTILGGSSAAIAERLGYGGPDEIIHRNDLVLL